MEESLAGDDQATLSLETLASVAGRCLRSSSDCNKATIDGSRGNDLLGRCLENKGTRLRGLNQVYAPEAAPPAGLSYRQRG
jgi:hypothetical protein